MERKSSSDPDCVDFHYILVVSLADDVYETKCKIKTFFSSRSVSMTLYYKFLIRPSRCFCLAFSMKISRLFEKKDSLPLL